MDMEHSMADRTDSRCTGHPPGARSVWQAEDLAGPALEVSGCRYLLERPEVFSSGKCWMVLTMEDTTGVEDSTGEDSMGEATSRLLRYAPTFLDCHCRGPCLSFYALEICSPVVSSTLDLMISSMTASVSYPYNRM